LSIFISPGQYFLTAFAALPQKLKEVAIYLETSFLRKPPLQFTKVTVSKIGHHAAVRANQVMVVFRGPPHQVATAVAPSVHFTNEAKLG
jgi:hypothetical protein